jgi:hypothetical protein
LDKLTLRDVLAPKAYAPLRDQRRAQVIALKKRRRVSVGPQITLLFENRETVRAQVEEMCRAESIEDDEKIQHELDVYNAILPEPGELAATLFIEVTSDRALQRILEQLVGLPEHVWLVAGESRSRATFDRGQFEADKLAAVQYIKFPLSPEAQAALRTPGAQVRLSIDHPHYQHTALVGDEVRAELAKDLD